MYKKIKVIINYSKLSQSKFITKVNHIVLCMKGNENFPDQGDAVAALGKDAEGYTEGLANPKSKANTALKRGLRISIAAKLKEMGMQVEITGDNNEQVLISSGFDLKRPGAPYGILPAAKNLKAQILYNGRVKISNPKIPGAASYLYECTAVPVTDASVWMRMESTAASTIFSGLEIGKQYAFRVSGIGANPARVFSAIIFSYAL